VTSPRGDRRAAGPIPAAISLTLPDGQTVWVRLHARQEVAGPHPWRYLVGVPSWIARPDGGGGGRVHRLGDRPAADTHRDLSGVPTWRLPGPPPQPDPGWVVRPAPERRGRTVVHDAACRHASGGGTELGTQEAVDALMRDGARACTDCDAAAVLVPALELGQGHG
jgi:hypothetical protein